MPGEGEGRGLHVGQEGGDLEWLGRGSATYGR